MLEKCSCRTIECPFAFLIQVPVRASGGLLFELLGQSAGDPFVDEDDIPIVLRSWQAQNFLVTVLHLKGPVSNINVLGITEVQVIDSYQNNLPLLSAYKVMVHTTCNLFVYFSSYFICWFILIIFAVRLFRNFLLLEVIMYQEQCMKS